MAGLMMMMEHGSVRHPQMEVIWHSCKATNFWLSTPADRLCKDSVNQ